MLARVKPGRIKERDLCLSVGRIGGVGSLLLVSGSLCFKLSSKRQCYDLIDYIDSEYWLLPLMLLYSLFLSDFSNALSKQDLKVLAEMDDQEVVREVQVG